MLSVADLLKVAGDTLPRMTIDNLMLVVMTISRHPLTTGRFGKYLVNVYPSGGHRLAFLNLAGDLRGACTSAVKIGVGCLDGDHHRG